MRILLPLVFAFFASLAAPIGAVSLSEKDALRMQTADVVLLGEFHDNPAHHRVQAELVSQTTPSAIVFEMLTPEQAARATGDLRKNEAALADALGWTDAGWPDFSMYYPIFAAAPRARVFGAAVPRAQARLTMDVGIAAAFGAEADFYGLTRPLPGTEQEKRAALQAAAHCDALPEEMLPVMVDIQRMRDARLAQAAIHALAETGGPVVIITGNGHARTDWGVPRFLKRVASEFTVFSLGQSEDGAALSGDFDLVLDAPSIDRPDPCDAVRK